MCVCLCFYQLLARLNLCAIQLQLYTHKSEFKLTPQARVHRREQYIKQLRARKSPHNLWMNSSKREPCARENFFYIHTYTHGVGLGQNTAGRRVRKSERFSGENCERKSFIIKLKRIQFDLVFNVCIVAGTSGGYGWCIVEEMCE